MGCDGTGPGRDADGIPELDCLMDDPPSAPPPVHGDSKDWTWVLNRPCPQCHFDVRRPVKADIGRLLREVTEAWMGVLADGRGELRQRPEPTVWSPLEYAAHVRDVFALYSHRLDLMMTEDGPHYPDWDQDVTAVASRYDQEDPQEVGVALSSNGNNLAEQFDEVTASEWQRTGFRSDGAAFTVESFARYLLHDPVHHLWDVGVTFEPSDERTEQST